MTPRPTCPNHPDKPVKAKGLCMACYQKERRHEIRQETHRMLPGRHPDRPKNGSGVIMVLSFVDHTTIWDALNKRTHKPEPTPENPDPCHVWTGAKTKNGYGLLFKFAHGLLAHRLVRGLTGGDPHTEVVMHTCDNPACVNPAHLKDGTYMENTQDMDAKGRRVNNEALHLRDRARHPNVKPVWTPERVYPSATLAAEGIGRHPRWTAIWAQRGQMMHSIGRETEIRYLDPDEVAAWRAAGMPEIMDFRP